MIITLGRQHGSNGHDIARLLAAFTVGLGKEGGRLADIGNAIFVGRCADYVLRNRDDVLRVFIMADMPFRIKTIMKRKNLTEDQAKKLIREVDKDRSSYYKYYTDQIWGESGNYDLCIDSSRIGVDGAVEVIESFMKALEK